VRWPNALNCGLHFRHQGARGKSYFVPPQSISSMKTHKKVRIKMAQKHFNELKYNKHHNKQENTTNTTINKKIKAPKLLNVKTPFKSKMKMQTYIRTCTYELREAFTDPIVLFDDAAKYCNRTESVLHEQMNMNYSWNDTDSREPTYYNKDLHRFHSQIPHGLAWD
jgi:hypothetical protein